MPIAINGSGSITGIVDVNVSGATTSGTINVSTDASTIRLTDTDTALSDGELSSQIEFYSSDSDAAGVKASIKAIGNGSLGNCDLAISTGTNTECLRIDSDGRLLVGTSDAYAATAGTDVPVLQSVSNVNPHFLAIRTTADGTPSHVVLGKTRGSAYQVVSDNDSIGLITFQAGDGTNLIRGAEIRAQVDGTPGANDMPGRLIFSTTADGASSPTERMRILSNGEFRIGQTSTSIPGLQNTTTGIGFEPHNGSIFLSRADSGCLFLNVNANSAIAYFSRSGNNVGSISVTTTGTNFNQSSDYRLKENVAPVIDGITRLQQLKPNRFNFIADPDKTFDGFIAHEVQSIVPEAITGEKDAVNEDGSIKPQGIDQSKLVPLLTAALQEAITRIETLETKVAALESA